MRSDIVCQNCSLNGCIRLEPEGPSHPDFVVICGFPTPEDASRKHPFSGKNSHVLRSVVQYAIRSLQLPVNDEPTYTLSYAVWCAPKFNEERRKFDIDVVNVQTCSYYVRSWLDKVHPKSIVVLGADAIKSLGIKENIRNIRGSILEFTLQDGMKVPVVPSYHIVNATRDPGLIPTLVKDVCKAVRLSKSVEFDNAVNATVCTKTDDILAKLREAENYVESVWAQYHKLVAVALDTETSSLNPHVPDDRVIAISLSYKDGEGFSYPFQHRSLPFTDEEFHAVFAATEHLLSNPHVALVGCNGKFDYKWLAYHYGMKMNEYRYDCQIAEHLLDEDKKGEYSLKDITRDRLPGLGNYEHELTDLRKRTQEKFNEEWHTQEDAWRAASQDAVLAWWLNRDEAERTSILGEWSGKGLVELKDTDALLKVKYRKLHGEMVITKKYADTVYKVLRRINPELCPGLVLPERTHGSAPRQHTFEDVDYNVMLKYAALDAITTRMIYQNQRAGFRHDQKLIARCHQANGKPLNTPKLSDSFYKISMPLSRVLGHMEYYGVRFDRDKCEQYRQKLVETIEELKDRLYQEVGYKFSLSSSAPDLAKILFEDMGLPVLKRTETGNPSTDAQTLKDLSDMQDLPLINNLLTYRKLDKCLHTYIENWLKMSAGDGKIHCSFNQIGTATYRLSSNNPNLQNVPFALKEANLNLKALFIPDSDDYDLYDLDISNAEMRVLTAYSKDAALIDAFNTGKDLHCLTASGISNYTYDDLLANKEDKTTDQYRKRQLAKRVNFGTIYCVGPETLKQQLWSEMRIDESVEQCREYLDNFFKTYPGVEQYIINTKQFVRDNHFTYTYTGRRRRFKLSEISPAFIGRTERQAVNARIQTTSSDMVVGNLIDVHNALVPLGGRVLLTVHDSIVFQAPKGITGMPELLKKLVTENTAERYPWLPVVWKFDCGRGPNYGDTHDEVV